MTVRSLKISVTQKEVDEVTDLECRLKYALRREGFDEYRAAYICLLAYYGRLREKYGVTQHSIGIDLTTNEIQTYELEDIGKSVPDAGDLEPPNTA